MTDQMATDHYNAFPNHGVGLACGRFTALIDIDTPSPAMNEKLRDMALEHPGETPLIRQGQPPKLALVYRAAESIISAQCGLIDILELGTQVVCFGTHPKTGSEYYWPSGLTPATTSVELLPSVDNDMLSRFMDEAVALSDSPRSARPKFSIDSAMFVVPMTSITVLVSQLFIRIFYGRYRARRRARQIINRKYYDAGSGIKRR